jgi:hypothetical protein
VYGPDGSLYIPGNKLLRVTSASLIERLRFNIDGTTADLFSEGLAVDSTGCLYIPAGYHIIKATPRR